MDRSEEIVRGRIICRIQGGETALENYWVSIIHMVNKYFM